MQNEFLWLLWLFAAAIVTAAVIALVAYASGLAEAVYLEARAGHRRRRRRARAARLDRRLRAGTREVERDLRMALARPRPAPSGTVLRFERTRDGLMAVTDATHEEQDR